MEHKTGIKEHNKQTRHRVGELLRKQYIEDPEKTNTKHERFLAFLKSRYGYTNEKAIGELERLLKQFYSTNKSLGIHRARPHSKHPHIG